MKPEPSTFPTVKWKSRASDERHDSRGSDSGKLVANEFLRVYPMPAWKRSLDFVLILAALPVVLPVMLAVALWIRLVSKGSVLFFQDRVGFGGEVFSLRKFRTMETSAGDRVHTDHVRELMKTNKRMTKLDQLGDKRLIPGGAFLRTTGLDELPQLLNVLRGELSLVGPRPCVQEEYILYREDEKKRFGVHPGLTGYWQVMGKNRTTFSEMIEMDDHYVSHRSLGLDLWIILKTPLAILRQLSDLLLEKQEGDSPESGH